MIVVACCSLLQLATIERRRKKKSFLPLSVLGLKKTEVSLPLVPHDLPAGEAPDGDDHCW